MPGRAPPAARAGTTVVVAGGLSIADGVGILGAAAIVLAYFLLQLGRLDPLSLTYSAANGLGAAAIIFSLVFDFNLSAFAIESFWLAISLFGVYRALTRRRIRAVERQGPAPD